MILLLPLNLFRNRMLIKDKNDDILVLALPDLPADLREPLFRHFQLAFGEAVKDTDSRAQGKDHTFECLYFSFYNRYSTRVSAI